MKKEDQIIKDMEKLFNERLILLNTINDSSLNMIKLYYEDEIKELETSYLCYIILTLFIIFTLLMCIFGLLIIIILK